MPRAPSRRTSSSCVPVSGALGGREWRRRLAQDERLRPAVYRRTISRHWMLAGLAVGIAGLADMPLSALGVRGPRLIVPGPAAFVAEAALLLVVDAGRPRARRSPAGRRDRRPASRHPRGAHALRRGGGHRRRRRGAALPRLPDAVRDRRAGLVLAERRPGVSGRVRRQPPLPGPGHGRRRRR